MFVYALDYLDFTDVDLRRVIYDAATKVDRTTIVTNAKITSSMHIERWFFRQTGVLSFNFVNNVMNPFEEASIGVEEITTLTEDSHTGLYRTNPEQYDYTKCNTQAKM